MAPEHKNAHYNLGVALNRTGRSEEAGECFRRALTIDSGFSAAYLELAWVLRENGKTQEALEVLGHGEMFCVEDAVFLCRSGGMLVDLRQWKRAARCFRKVLELDRDSVSARIGLGAVEVDTGRDAYGLPRFEQVLRSHPDSAEAHFHRARGLFELGQIEDAVDGFRRAEALGLKVARNNIASIIPGDPRADNQEILEVRREWTQTLTRAPDQPTRFASRRRGGSGKLQIGYVSRSFQHRTWMKPVWALLNRHDRARFAIHLFSDTPVEAVAYGYHPHPYDQYHDTTALSAHELAALIEHCGIDLLIDLNSYGALARLALYASKPAPLIIGWFNSFATTGMEEFDYLIGDDEVIPAKEERFYVERIVRIPGSYLTFEVNYTVPDVAPPPWADILEQCPSAHLFLKNALQRRNNDNRSHLAGSPGVPVITFRGDRWASRTSASLLVNGGLAEFVAEDCGGYVRAAVELANDPSTPGRLEKLRMEMRRRLRTSPVCDVETFTRNMEEIYADFRQRGKPA